MGEVEKLRTLADSMIELGKCYHELADLQESPDKDSKESEDKATMLVGKIMMLAVKVQALQG